MLDDEGDDEEELVEAVRASEEDLARPPLEGVHLCWSYPTMGITCSQYTSKNLNNLKYKQW